MEAVGDHPDLTYYQVQQTLTGDARCTGDVQGNAEIQFDVSDGTEWASGSSGIKRVVLVEGVVGDYAFEDSTESWVTTPMD